MKGHNPYLRATLMEVVDKQLETNDPPETRLTYERLLREGHTEEDAKRLIACAVTEEIFDILKQKKPFNRVRYVAALNALPKPWDET